MVRIEHFTKLDTNIDDLYNSIKEELQKEKNLKIVSEIKGEMNGLPLRSITAVNKSLVGTRRGSERYIYLYHRSSE